ncbi:MAG: DUF1223 domain-containing protein [Planctomycetes bacterium]|nr:DUF1223 domain-containing protein [Planctomycetota bacterium]
MKAIIQLILSAAAALASAPRETATNPEAPGIAVLELFTSEGCSSCPPADRVLTQLADEAAKDGRKVYALAFHVDYWDNLGWPDRFASPQATQRQHAYAKTLKTPSVYTPQLIVNGTDEFVGSDRVRAAKAIADALSRPCSPVSARLEERTPDQPFTISITAAACPNLQACVALTQDGLTTEVKKGENAGRLLPHSCVVRAFTTITLDGQGHATASLTPPKDVDASRSRIIVFVHNDARQVIAATDVKIAAASKPVPASPAK